MLKRVVPRFFRLGRNGVLVSLLVLVFFSLSVGGSIDEAGHKSAAVPFADDAGSPDGLDREHHASPSGRSPGPAENTVKGEIYLTTPEWARSFSAQSMHKVTHYRLNVVGEAPFELHAQNTGMRACSGSNCLELPDFDIAFFRDDGSTATVVERHYNVGAEEGTVPRNADFAHIYLRTPGLVPDNSRGYGFVYLQGHPGSDVVPVWQP